MGSRDRWRDHPSSTAPVIGITTYLEPARMGVWDVRAAVLPEVYLDSVIAAGGIAVLLPPQPVSDEIVDRVLDSLDGLVLSGGADIDPGLYGQEPHEATAPPRDDRDAWERALITRAIARRMPFLGICRGAQMLNVALGGTLHQHLPEIVGSTKYQPAPAQFGPVDVEVTENSRLAEVLGQTASNLNVLCYHHQGIDRVADGLTVTAVSDDGVIEAVELGAVPFGIAVQWHPEQDAADRRLFEGLVRAAR
ncbi:gamma-glutamyl-gamma-aminobutyrate hydrolase [Marisediminicola antarctica]|uniref:Gamma-glutamyl-gamma-aminobutyrate hydrolase n=1 Tax=Marisediminicola antarctica TaxID=674079 RepID=A0A7L5AKX1_9MICO|nr:gamma-glutamyl-gamma-aminobutyrate hydrolase [Marisediminicola antarctica]